MGGVLTKRTVYQMDLLTLTLPTSNSKTMSVVMEQWCVDCGMISEEERIHAPEIYQQLTAGAKKLAASRKE